MDPKAIKKAKDKLCSARICFERTKESQDYESFCREWESFLIAFRGVYTVLEQGAKGLERSKQWFAKKSSERKRDPLLQYIFQARHASEHGLEDVTKLSPGHLEIGKRSPGYSNALYIKHLHLNNGSIVSGEPESMDGKPVLIEQKRPHASLSSVTNRGQTYPVPGQHLGLPLEDNLPIPVGELALKYLCSLVQEAEALKAPA